MWTFPFEKNPISLSVEPTWRDCKERTRKNNDYMQTFIILTTHCKMCVLQYCGTSLRVASALCDNGHMKTITVNVRNDITVT